MSGRDPLFKAGVLGLSLALVLTIFAAGFWFFALRGGPENAVASRDEEPTFSPLVRSDPPGDAWQEERPQVEQTEEERPEVRVEEREPARAEPPPLPAEPSVEVPEWPEPEEGELEEASEERDYGALPQGAILGLTIDALGVQNAPVWGSDSQEYLDRGVVHVPETSLPWSNTPERNTFLAAHRIGYPGTQSRLLFYNLDQLAEGDRVKLQNPEGRTFEYEVSEMFVVSPYDSWVMGRVVDRDMVTLQTCTPIPTFEDRLIVRAERV